MKHWIIIWLCMVVGIPAVQADPNLYEAVPRGSTKPQAATKPEESEEESDSMLPVIIGAASVLVGGAYVIHKEDQHDSDGGSSSAPPQGPPTSSGSPGGSSGSIKTANPKAVVIGATFICGDCDYNNSGQEYAVDVKITYDESKKQIIDAVATASITVAPESDPGCATLQSFRLNVKNKVSYSDVNKGNLGNLSLNDTDWAAAMCN